MKNNNNDKVKIGGYTTIKSKNLAGGLAFITGQKYYAYDDGYSFKNTKEFTEAFLMLIDAQKRLKRV